MKPPPAGRLRRATNPSSSTQHRNWKLSYYQLLHAFRTQYLWKRDHVDGWLGDAPVIWIDDDFTDLDHEWARERTARGYVTALVQPDPHIGLLAEHLVEVLAWAVALLPVTQADTAGVP
ncbi:hypothetical protein GCM10017687_12720 [Streptomyces echinatus]|uniref:Uncharacterized protein n=1 Tax=Streptomyces echinatus TaxID=67293 RepID=A0A7W9Q2Y1_9ACTN|nr:hypothetical protein [Streptomyces echinatus]